MDFTAHHPTTRIIIVVTPIGSPRLSAYIFSNLYGDIAQLPPAFPDDGPSWVPSLSLKSPPWWIHKYQCVCSIMWPKRSHGYLNHRELFASAFIEWQYPAIAPLQYYLHEQKSTKLYWKGADILLDRMGNDVSAQFQYLSSPWKRSQGQCSIILQFLNKIFVDSSSKDHRNPWFIPLLLSSVDPSQHPEELREGLEDASRHYNFLGL